MNPKEAEAVLAIGEQIIAEVNAGVAKLREEERRRLQLLKKEVGRGR